MQENPMKTTNRTIRRATALTLTAALHAALVPQAAIAGSITVKGSDTMVVLAQRWAEEYMKLKPSVTIQVTGGGSGTGIAALVNGTTDLANSSRKIKPDEKLPIESANKRVTEIPVALDALSVVVHKENPVSALTLTQIGKIYSGYLNNWKQVGGPDHAIIRYSRESNSGTYSFVKDEVLKGRDYAADCQTMSGTSEVAEAVSKDKWGIGYGGVAYFAKVPMIKILSIKKTEDSPAVSPIGANGQPDLEVVYGHSYGLYRHLYMYSAGDLEGEKKAYVDWILGPQGQKIVEQVEYIPLPRK
jgi:phosphate transport system substrate-binding protein